MGLSERLERLAKQYDRKVWLNRCLDPDLFELADTLKQAANAIRGQALLIDDARQSMARH